jgi:hypothetical protein
VLVGCLSAACTAGREESVPTTAAPTTVAAVTAPATTEASTTTAPMAAPAPTVAPVTVAPATVAPATTLPVTTGIVLPPDLGHLVASAPGVSTPGDIWQLAPKLWLFLPSESAGDPNLTPPKPEDAEILIAYARKQKALNLAVSKSDLALSSPDVLTAYTNAGLNSRVRALAPRAIGGHRLNLGGGVVFRPRVFSEPRTATTAFVTDCTLDWSYWVNGSGESAGGSSREAGAFGVVAAMVRQSSGWRVDLDGPEDFACVR